MPDQQTPSELWVMLGEIRSNIQWLVADRKEAANRLRELEEGVELKFDQHETRLTRLEHMKVRIGVLVAALSVLVPTLLTILANYFGVI